MTRVTATRNSKKEQILRCVEHFKNWLPFLEGKKKTKATRNLLLKSYNVQAM